MNTILWMVIVALAAYVYYQRVTYVKALEEAVRNRFVCYYCQLTFSNKDLEKVGKYHYCQQYGMRRQKELNV